MYYLTEFLHQEVAPKEQSSISSSSTRSITERELDHSRQDKEVKRCKIEVAPCSSKLEESALETVKSNTLSHKDLSNLARNSQDETKEEEDIIVEIMAPCYGGIYNINTNEDVESCNNNTCLLSDDETSEKAALLPSNHSRPENDNESEKSRNIEHPKDSYHFVYVTFFFLGLSTLLPWNFFISINQFWDYRFRDVNSTNFIYFISGGNSSGSDGNQTELQKQFTSYLSIGKS